MSFILMEENWEVICRSCLQTWVPVNSIDNYSQSRVGQIYQLLCQVEFINDGLPKLFCPLCMATLVQFQEFFNRSLENEKLLQKENNGHLITPRILHQPLKKEIAVDTSSSIVLKRTHQPIIIEKEKMQNQNPSTLKRECPENKDNLSHRPLILEPVFKMDFTDYVYETESPPEYVELSCEEIQNSPPDNASTTTDNIP